MSYVLVVYDRRAGRLVREEAFEDRRAALAARFAAQRQRADGDDVEVVVLGAMSHDVLRLTHGRYFRSVAEQAGDALASR